MKPSRALAGLRERRGLSPIDVARRAGLAPCKVVELERRDDLSRVSVSTVRRYALALGADLEIAFVLDGQRYLVGT